MTAIAVTIAGSDSGGGAGIQADLKTFSALGVYGASVITALTAQNTLTVTGVFDAPPDFVRLQMDAVFGDLRVNATKIGMLSKPEIIRAVAGGLDALFTGPVVLDPVMVTSTGVVLISDEAIDALKSELFPRCALITPNLLEAARLLDAPVAEDRDAMIRQAEGLLRLGARSVLLKGGHLPGSRASDLLLHGAAEGGGQVWLDAPMIDTRHTHGTGCTLSAAIASGLALGRDLGTAVAEAKSYLHGAIAAAERLDIGSGNGPVHHFWRTWPQA